MNRTIILSAIAVALSGAMLAQVQQQQPQINPDLARRRRGVFSGPPGATHPVAPGPIIGAALKSAGLDQG
jgi:hypothetical protein